jgi:transcriptional regulator
LTFDKSARIVSKVKGKESGVTASSAASTAASTEEVRQGTLDLLILTTVSMAPAHGWAIAQRIQQLSGEVFQVNQGSLYPALHRLEHAGLVSAEWSSSDSNRRAKYYRLTAAGRRRLAREAASWERFSGAVWSILQATRA